MCFYSDPDRAMVVLLPGDVDNDDVTIRLQTTLIEAFCWEYDIRLLKIDNTKDIGRLLARANGACADRAKLLKRVKNTDFNCILVEVNIIIYVCTAVRLSFFEKLRSIYPLVSVVAQTWFLLDHTITRELLKRV